MRNFLLLLMLLTTPSMVASTITKSDIIATIEHQRRLVQQAQDAATEAKEQLVLVQNSIKQKDDQISTLTKENIGLNNSLKKWKAIAEKLLFGISLAAGIIVGIVFFQFSTIIITSIYPPALPFSILISFGVGATIFSAVWASLVHL
jgi:hypothetical protein